MIEEKKYHQPTSPFWESLKAQYPNHWVLIGNPVKPRGKYAIEAGEVLFASEKKDETLAEIPKYKHISRALEFTGQRPQRLFLLS